MDISRRILHIILNFLCIFFFFDLSYQDPIKDTIYQGEEIRDWEQLRSENNLFRLQFFSPATTQHRYLGIFFNISPGDRPIWVANRDIPISDASGSLMIGSGDWKLKVSYGDGNAIVLASSPATAAARNASATLLHNGNLVFRVLNLDGSVNQTIWQSFDYPTDTLVPGMKLGINLRTGHRWSLTTSVSDVIPASGSFTLGLDPSGTSQIMIWGQARVLWSSGIWQNGEFSCSRHDSLHFRYISNQDERYFEYLLDENRSFMRYKLELSSWITENGLQIQPNGWNYSRDGCNKNMTLPVCRKGEFWFERQGYLYGKSFLFDNKNMSLLECKMNCVKNCSCLAYASVSDNGTGCEIWDQSMQFMGTSDVGAPSRQVFIRSDTYKGSSASKWWTWLVLAVILLVALCTSFWVARKLRLRGRGSLSRSEKILLAELGNNMAPQRSFGKSRSDQLHRNMSPEVHLFSLDSIATATNNFSVANKLGEGGFGPVYKGKLVDGQDVAIKRLSRDSGQGFVEFKNEILLIAKLQHNNLVRLLGCCIQADERILVYEYMTNKSLDFFLFNPSKKEVLKWNVRFNIIEGIAQGLLYLHKYSRLRVIHRDLKASNILLDGKMNPKISDFGLARIFETQQSEANTKRIVGTYGYMSPEYAIKGIVSLKTDVFSFGILLLEIVSGKKNNSRRDSDYPYNLVGHAWELWRESKGLELMDSTLVDDSIPCNEVLRCIHIGLLCVQDKATDRPSMSEVVSMLTNETTPLPATKPPAFFVGMNDQIENISVIDASISTAEPR